MKIRKAQAKDCPRLLELLNVIRQFHYEGRPDIFRTDTVKYNLSNLTEMLSDLTKPIFVAVDEADVVQAYAMLQIKENAESAVLKPYRVLYLDDLCVADSARRSGLGAELIEFCKAFGRQQNCSRLELNVWEFPGSALPFYEKQGFRSQRREMEFLL